MPSWWKRTEGSAWRVSILWSSCGNEDKARQRPSCTLRSSSGLKEMKVASPSVFVLTSLCCHKWNPQCIDSSWWGQSRWCYPAWLARKRWWNVVGIGQLYTCRCRWWVDCTQRQTWRFQNICKSFGCKMEFHVRRTSTRARCPCWAATERTRWWWSLRWEVQIRCCRASHVSLSTRGMDAWEIRHHRKIRARMRFRRGKISKLECQLKREMLIRNSRRFRERRKNSPQKSSTKSIATLIKTRFVSLSMTMPDEFPWFGVWEDWGFARLLRGVVSFSCGSWWFLVSPKGFDRLNICGMNGRKVLISKRWSKTNTTTWIW